MDETDPSSKSLDLDKRLALKEVFGLLISHGIAQKYYKHLDLERHFQQTSSTTLSAEIDLAVRTNKNEESGDTSFAIVKLNPASGEAITDSNIIVGDLLNDGKAVVTSTHLDNTEFDFTADDILILNQAADIQAEAGLIVE